MASELRVNTLKDASGNNSIGLSYVAEGTNKLWVNLNGTTVDSTADLTGVRNSFATASVVDNGTGDHTINFTNAMSNNTYIITHHLQRSVSITENANCTSYQNVYDDAHSTSSFRIATNRSDTNAHEDELAVMLSLLGDLA